LLWSRVQRRRTFCWLMPNFRRVAPARWPCRSSPVGACATPRGRSAAGGRGPRNRRRDTFSTSATRWPARADDAARPGRPARSRPVGPESDRPLPEEFPRRATDSTANTRRRPTALVARASEAILSARLARANRNLPHKKPRPVA
jgi:hypothetical protein